MVNIFKYVMPLTRFKDLGIMVSQIRTLLLVTTGLIPEQKQYMVPWDTDTVFQTLQDCIFV